MYVCISNSYRISNPFSPRSGKISFVSNPLRFDHFARAAGNFFNIYRRLFSFKKSHKGPEKVCVEKISSRRRDILCVEKIRSRPRGILCVDKIGSVPPDRQSLSRQLFFPADFCGPADRPALPHIGTLARLIIKYPACQLLGKKHILKIKSVRS